MQKEVKKILVLRYRFIGDTILTIPFLRNLRYNYPDAQIDMVVSPNSGEVLKYCPYINNLIYFNTTKKHRYETSKDEKRKTFFSYVKMFRNNKYDEVYVLKRSLSSAFLAFCSGIKQRVGFNTEGRGFLLTKRVKYNSKQHEIESFLDCLRGNGLSVRDNYLEEWLGADEQDKINKFISENSLENRKKIVVHASSGNRMKEWRKDYFARVIEYIANNLDSQVIFMGAKSDKNLYDDILDLINVPLKVEPLNLCGQFDLCESLALLSKVDLIVGCDTGNLHMAASVNTPVIAIFGPMNSVRWKPFNDNVVVLQSNKPCVPCELHKKCNFDRACLKDITPEMVIDKINSVLS